MLGLMQSSQLLISKFIDFAEVNHPNSEVVGMLPEGGKIRTNYGEISSRSKKVAQAIERMGINQGDRVGTLAWNSHRHIEIWYGVSGFGAVAHTINPRLFPEQLIYIINHAEDRVLFLDITFVPLIEKLAEHLTTVETYVIMVGREHMPETSLENVICYEELIEAEDGNYTWPSFEEDTACSLCYTSGTTGEPKGAVHLHRSNYLHTIASLMKDAINIGACDTMLPVVPMFHANAWGIPYAAAASGTKLVLNGPHHDPETLHDLLIDEKVTHTAAVPTIWSGMLAYLRANDLGVGELKTVVIGGSAAPRSMIKAFKDDYNVWVAHAWGMTETSPLGTIGMPNAQTAQLEGEEMTDMQCKQGRGIIGIEMCIMDEDGTQLPRDGKTSGRLMVRGPWVVAEYFRGDGGNIIEGDGWFDTGDMACIGTDGFMQITDRSKDVIKSGGEWISSIDLENAAVSHPDILEAAVIGVYHPQWEERPLMIIIPNEGKTVTYESLIEHLTPLVVKWWLPDGMEIVSEIPHTATGKISKKDLRVQFKDFKYS